MPYPCLLRRREDEPRRAVTALPRRREAGAASEAYGQCSGCDAAARERSPRCGSYSPQRNTAAGMARRTAGRLDALLLGLVLCLPIPAPRGDRPDDPAAERCRRGIRLDRARRRRRRDARDRAHLGRRRVARCRRSGCQGPRGTRTREPSAPRPRSGADPTDLGSRRSSRGRDTLAASRARPRPFHAPGTTPALARYPWPLQRGGDHAGARDTCSPAGSRPPRSSSRGSLSPSTAVLSRPRAPSPRLSRRPSPTPAPRPVDEVEPPVDASSATGAGRAAEGRLLAGPDRSAPARRRVPRPLPLPPPGDEVLPKQPAGPVGRVVNGVSFTGNDGNRTHD